MTDRGRKSSSFSGGAPLRIERLKCELEMIFHGKSTFFALLNYTMKRIFKIFNVDNSLFVNYSCLTMIFYFPCKIFIANPDIAFSHLF